MIIKLMAKVQSFSDNFRSAAADYLLLMEHHYPQKAILKLVGDRFKLNGVERTMLYRGISTDQTCKERRKKMFAKIPTSRITIHIDTYNVLLTIGSYLNGNRVFIALDGLLRDASEIHGKAFRNELLNRSLDLLLTFVASTKIKNIFFYLDRPVSHSGELAKRINDLIRKFSFKGEATVHDSADYILKRTAAGICATSDSAIIDHSLIPVFDLARKTLEYHFDPKFCDLKEVTGVRCQSIVI
jgi:hypothetical protein